MAKRFIRLYLKKSKILLLLFYITFSLNISAQDFLSLNLQSYKDENAWNFFGNAQGKYLLSDFSSLKLSNIYSSRSLIARDIYQEDNHFVFVHNYFFNPAINLDTEVNSKIIRNDATFQQFSQNTLNFKPNIYLGPAATIEPIGGIGLAIQKGHEDEGWIYGLNANGSLFSDKDAHSFYTLNSLVGDFGPRQNRRYDAKIYWSQKFSEAASDSFTVGTFYNYTENYITEENLSIESYAKDSRFIRNILDYDLSKSLRSKLFTTYEWKNLERINPFQLDTRTEYALENIWFWTYIKPGYSISWNLRFRNEQRKGLNTAINTDSRLTSFQITGDHSLWENHFLKYDLYLSKYETDTPTDVQQDRDELRWIAFGGYRWQPDPLFTIHVQGEVSFSHQMYLFARYSNNNYKNQLYRIKTGFTIKPINQLRNTLLFGIDANYNIFDFESMDEILRSRLVKTWTLSDTLQYHFTKNIAVTYVFFLNNSQLGSFDPDEILFYRSTDRISQQHQIRFSYFWEPDLAMAVGAIFYDFTQFDPVENSAKQNNQYNFIPQLDISFFPGAGARISLNAQMVNNRVTYFEPDMIVTDRVFFRGRLNMDFLF